MGPETIILSAVVEERIPAAHKESGRVDFKVKITDPEKPSVLPESLTITHFLLPKDEATSVGKLNKILATLEVGDEIIIRKDTAAWVIVNKGRRE